MRPLFFVSLIALFANIADAQLLPFLDDFSDGNTADGRPGTWLPVNNRIVDAASGDLVLTHNAQFSTHIQELDGLQDVSIRTQLRFIQLSKNQDAAILFARAGAGSYWGELTSDGLLAYGEVAGGNVSVWEIRSTSFNPVAGDVLMQFDVIADRISLTVWPESSLMPTKPQLTRTDRSITEGGQLGITFLPNVDGGNATASAVFRYVSVVPEPSSLPLLVVGMILAGRRIFSVKSPKFPGLCK
jgi:hypothetical protein